MKNIGIYGGSFNPVHLAHEIFAKQFIIQYDLDKLFIIPTYISPFKSDVALDSEMNNHRIEMLRIAFKNDYKIIIDDYEIKKEGISYTFETINYFKQKFQDSKLYMLIGEDNAINFDKWKNWEYILQNVNLVIMSRISINEQIVEKIENLPHFKNYKLNFLYCSNYDISSTQIRYRIKNKKSISGLLNEEIANYISANNLYD